MPKRALKRLVARVRRMESLPGSRMSWTEIAVISGVLAAIAGVIWLWREAATGALPSPEELSSWFGQYRRAWYALPLVVAVFTALGLAFVPVLLIIAATGIAFGPWLGPPYAMTGTLCSASVGFAIGRVAGARRLQQLGGPRVLRLSHALERNGTLAVFFLRKVPAPFLLANVLAGASRVRYRDFIVGTVLGMGAFVIAFAGFGYQLTQVFQHPTPAMLLATAGILAVPFSLAWATNRILKRRFVAAALDPK